MPNTASVPNFAQAIRHAAALLVGVIVFALAGMLVLLSLAFVLVIGGLILIAFVGVWAWRRLRVYHGAKTGAGNTNASHRGYNRAQSGGKNGASARRSTDGAAQRESNRGDKNGDMVLQARRGPHGWSVDSGE